MSQPAAPSDRTRVRRVSTRGAYDTATIHAILDEAPICHVGFVDQGQPFVIPTNHWRIGDRLYLHGSPGSRMLRALVSGQPACVSVTLLDGLVLARSAFHHSMNYRSVVVLAKAEAVEDEAGRLAALEALSEHVMPGRWKEARKPNEKELAATLVVSLLINEASAKIRTGPPSDDEPDYSIPIWAGVVPLSLTAGTPVPDPKLTDGIAVPDYVMRYLGG